MSDSYFVAKCYNIDALKTSQLTNIWACNERKQPPQPKDILGEALLKGKVYLIFSVNNCHGWHGYAEMLDYPGCVKDDHLDSQLAQINSNESSQIWHRFHIKWGCIFLKEHGERCLPFKMTENIFAEEGKNTPVNSARNFQEICTTTGKTLKDMIDNYYEELCKIKAQKKEEALKKLGDPFFTPGQDKDIKNVWAELYKKVEELGTIHLACAFGSQRYNLQTPESDMDMFVVYEASTKNILGFNPPAQTIKNRDTESCDYTIHELHRYCQLLVEGDPRCVETLFLHPSSIYWQSPAWKKLTQLRHTFLNRTVLEKYMRDALGSKGTKQMDKYVKSGETSEQPMPKKICKLFYIIIRLLQNASNIAYGEDLVVYRSEGSPQRELLMNIRQGKCSFQYIQEHLERLVEKINEAKASLSDEKIHKSILEDWLMELRYKSLKNSMDNTETT